MSYVEYSQDRKDQPLEEQIDRALELWYGKYQQPRPPAEIIVPAGETEHAGKYRDQVSELKSLVSGRRVWIGPLGTAPDASTPVTPRLGLTPPAAHPDVERWLRRIKAPLLPGLEEY